MLLPSWLSSLRSASPRTSSIRQRDRRRVPCRLHVEPLEDRCLLTAGLAASLVADIVPGTVSSNPEYLTNVNGTLFFRTADGNSPTGLWKSDGTSAGTVLLKSGQVRNLTNVNGNLFFSQVGGAIGWELWKTNGTSAGTVFVKSVAANYLTPVNGKVFFSGSDGKNGLELWVSDGTSSGTKLVKDINTTTHEEIRCTDERDRHCRTVQVANASSPNGLTNLNGRLLFTADDGTNGRELWRSDGTAKGTTLVKDIAPGSASSNLQNLTVVNGVAYFAAGADLWKSDGTAAGTVLVKANVSPTFLNNVNGTLFFKGFEGVSGRELWKSDGTAAGTSLVKDIYPGSADSQSDEYALAAVNGTLYFSAHDGVNGRELWKSDGTTAGTVLVSNISPGAASSGPGNLTNVNGLLYFTADDGANGRELWQSDGTEAGTILVRDIYPGSSGSDPASLVMMNSKLYFAATDPDHGRELWDPPPVSSGGHLLVISFDTDSVLRYQESTGAFVDTFVPHRMGGLYQPFGVVFGPHDHNVYVSSGQFASQDEPKARGVLRYDGTTGAFIDEFTERGHLSSPRGIIFGPDGNLYVADGNGPAGKVVRYNGTTGAFMDDFVSDGSGGLYHPAGLVFGPSVENPAKLDLYVAHSRGSVLRYDGTTGGFLGEFVAIGSGGLDKPTGLSFGPNGDLYVVSSHFLDKTSAQAAVLRFQGPSGKSPGAFIGTFVAPGSGGLLTPFGLLFGPDGNGDRQQDLYVTSVKLTNYKGNEHTSTVNRYDGVTGVFIDTFVTEGSGGLDQPGFMTFTETNPVTLAYMGGDRLMAATLPDVATHELLAANQARPLLSEAFARWQAAGVDTSAFATIDVHIADLGGTTLGMASSHTIWLDDNAAGWGWFVDSTPWDDAEFTTPGNQGERNRMDLLTVVMHELGHLLGHDHDEGGVMAETLEAGVRNTGLEDNDVALSDQVFEQLSDRRADAWLGAWLNEQFDSVHGRGKRRW